MTAEEWQRGQVGCGRGIPTASDSKTYINDPVVMTVKTLRAAGRLREGKVGTGLLLKG